MIEGILGTKTAEKIMLHIYHYGETHPSVIARDCGISKTAVVNQLDRFERAGILVSKLAGRTRLYMFNPKSPFFNPFREIIQIAYESIPIEKRADLFSARRRPRRKGKPIL